MQFTIKKSKTGGHFYFNLKANNGEIVATSEMYKSKQGCKKGIRAVKRSLFAPIYDDTLAIYKYVGSRKSGIIEPLK